MNIADKYRLLKSGIPEGVEIVIAAKTRSVDDVRGLIEAGATDIGENYVQEAEHAHKELGAAANGVRWHMIGHLQKNKVNKALAVFDVLQTVDSEELAEAINRRASKVIPVYVEINSGREKQKTGVFPDDAEKLICRIASYEKIRVAGLMTMGPRFGDPEKARPYFRTAKGLFDYFKSTDIPGVDMKVLSMGMSNTYKIAIEEGSTMVRLGSALFGACAHNGSRGV